MGFRRTVTLDKRLLNSAKALSFRDVGRGRFHVGKEVDPLLITRLAQMHSITHPTQATLVAIACFYIIRTLNGLLVLGKFTLGCQAHRDRQFFIIAVGGRFASIAHAVLTDHWRFRLSLSFAAWSSTVFYAPAIALVPTLGHRVFEPLWLKGGYRIQHRAQGLGHDLHSVEWPHRRQHMGGIGALSPTGAKQSRCLTRPQQLIQ